MLAAILLLTLATAQQMAVPSEGPSPGNLSEELFYASNHASGRKVCDRDLAAKLVQRFNERFGDRIRALKEVHEAKHGPDPSFIHTSDCFSLSEQYSQRQAMDDFETKLRALERKYGCY